MIDLLPHRPPFLFLDEIVVSDGTKLHARRTVRADEPHFAGHYPGNPIMPGVLLCEALLQAGCALMLSRGEAAPKGTPVVTRMNEVKFKRVVKPGELLDLHVEHESSTMGAHFMKGKASVEGKLACSLSFCVMFTEAA